MTDKSTSPAQEPTAPPVAEPLNTDPAPMIPKTRFDEVNTERNQLRERLAELESKQTAAAAKLLEEQGEYKELAAQRQQEIDRLKEYETQVQAFIEEAEKNNAAFIEQVPEDRRGLIPTGYNPRDLQSYLQNNRDLLLGQTEKPFTPPSTNGGAGTYQKSNGQHKPLTQTELAIAKNMGLTPEQYQEGKAKLKG